MFLLSSMLVRLYKYVYMMVRDVPDLIHSVFLLILLNSLYLYLAKR